MFFFFLGNFHIHPTEGFLVWSPLHSPHWKFQSCFILSFKNFLEKLWHLKSPYPHSFQCPSLEWVWLQYCRKVHVMQAKFSVFGKIRMVNWKIARPNKSSKKQRFETAKYQRIYAKLKVTSANFHGKRKTTPCHLLPVVTNVLCLGAY